MTDNDKNDVYGDDRQDDQGVDSAIQLHAESSSGDSGVASEAEGSAAVAGSLPSDNAPDVDDLGLSAEDRDWLLGGRKSEVVIDDHASKDEPSPVEAKDAAGSATSALTAPAPSSATDLTQAASPSSANAAKRGIDSSIFASPKSDPSPTTAGPLIIPPAPISTDPTSGDDLARTSVSESDAGDLQTQEVKGAPVKREIKKTRRARLSLTRVDPWTVMKTTFLFSIAFAIIMIVTVALLWAIVNASGVLSSIEAAINDVIANPESQSSFDVNNFITTGRVLGVTTLIAVANVVMTTALVTIFAFLYNLSAIMLGGIEITLSEE